MAQSHSSSQPPSRSAMQCNATQSALPRRHIYQIPVRRTYAMHRDVPELTCQGKRYCIGLQRPCMVPLPNFCLAWDGTVRGKQSGAAGKDENIAYYELLCCLSLRGCGAGECTVPYSSPLVRRLGSIFLLDKRARTGREQRIWTT